MMEEKAWDAVEQLCDGMDGLMKSLKALENPALLAALGDLVDYLEKADA
jgi:hypothetical protein